MGRCHDTSWKQASAGIAQKRAVGEDMAASPCSKLLRAHPPRYGFRSTSCWLIG